MIHNGIRVYVAGPYTQGNTVENTRAAVTAAERLWKLGYAPFVPHLSMLWEVLFSHDHQDWLDLDAEWVKVCHALLRLAGPSKGADKEVELAEGLGIPVFYSVEELHNAMSE